MQLNVKVKKNEESISFSIIDQVKFIDDFYFPFVSLNSLFDCNYTGIKHKK